jgi:hypothetical protein
MSGGKQPDLNTFVWDSFSSFLARRLNRLTSFFPPPPAEAPQRALVVKCFACLFGMCTCDELGFLMAVICFSLNGVRRSTAIRPKIPSRRTCSTRA